MQLAQPIQLEPLLNIAESIYSTMKMCHDIPTSGTHSLICKISYKGVTSGIDSVYNNALIMLFRSDICMPRSSNIKFRIATRVYWWIQLSEPHVASFAPEVRWMLQSFFTSRSRVEPKVNDLTSSSLKLFINPYRWVAVLPWTSSIKCHTWTKKTASLAPWSKAAGHHHP
jgi:hypothetical protein